VGKKNKSAKAQPFASLEVTRIKAKPWRRRDRQKNIQQQVFAGSHPPTNLLVYYKAEGLPNSL